MIAVKRLEIVTDATHSRSVVELLARHGLTGFTLLRGATGSGDRGPQLDDDVSGVSTNHLILTTCEPAQLAALAEELRPLLAKFGGICLVSDASWLRH